MGLLQSIALLLAFLLCTCCATYDIRQPPDILPTKVGGHILYETDTEVTLPCLATGHPQPTYEWLRDGKLLDPNARNVFLSHDHTVGSLTIRPLTSLDEGYYQCHAKNIYGTSVSKMYFLQRSRFGRYPISDVRNYTVEEGMPLKMECASIKSIPKPSFKWALAKTTTDTSPVRLINTRRAVKDEDGHLYFSYITRQDAQLSFNSPDHPSLLYKCNVFNSHLDFSIGGSYSRIITEPASGDALANKAPTLLHVTKSPRLTLKGDEVRIQCIFAGRPEIAVTWEPMPGSRSSLEEFGTVLVIRDVQFSDERKYQCLGKNSAGEATAEVTIEVQSAPVFDAQPMNMNATEMDTVSAECRVLEDTEPPATIDWFINGEPLDLNNPGVRTEVSDGGKRITVSRLCKDCARGSSDLRVIQCNASNVHGHVFADGYLNVLLKTVIVTPPVDLYLEVDDPYAVFRCEAYSDSSTPVMITWELDGKPLEFYADKRLIANGSSLTVDLKDLEYGKKREYEGLYSCFATNMYSSQGARARLTIDDGIILPPPWWVFLILALLALILLILLLILCCCCCYRHNRGGVYPVDEKERHMGNDPDKECYFHGFRDYIRPVTPPPDVTVYPTVGSAAISGGQRKARQATGNAQTWGGRSGARAPVVEYINTID